MTDFREKTLSMQEKERALGARLAEATRLFRRTDGRVVSATEGLARVARMLSAVSGLAVSAVGASAEQARHSSANRVLRADDADGDAGSRLGTGVRGRSDGAQGERRGEDTGDPDAAANEARNTLARAWLGEAEEQVNLVLRSLEVKRRSSVFATEHEVAVLGRESHTGSFGATATDAAAHVSRTPSDGSGAPHWRPAPAKVAPVNTLKAAIATLIARRRGSLRLSAAMAQQMGGEAEQAQAQESEQRQMCPDGLEGAGAAAVSAVGPTQQRRSAPQRPLSAAARTADVTCLAAPPLPRPASASCASHRPPPVAHTSSQAAAAAVGVAPLQGVAPATDATPLTEARQPGIAASDPRSTCVAVASVPEAGAPPPTHRGGAWSAYDASDCCDVRATGQAVAVESHLLLSASLLQESGAHACGGEVKRFSFKPNPIDEPERRARHAEEPQRDAHAGPESKAGPLPRARRGQRGSAPGVRVFAPAMLEVSEGRGAAHAMGVSAHAMGVSAHALANTVNVASVFTSAVRACHVPCPDARSPRAPLAAPCAP